MALKWSVVFMRLYWKPAEPKTCLGNLGPERHRAELQQGRQAGGARQAGGWPGMVQGTLFCLTVPNSSVLFTSVLVFSLLCVWKVGNHLFFV